MANIFWFYIFMMAVIFLIKKIRHTSIILNTIWFSSDGSVSNDALNNLTRLAQAIKDSGFRRHYQLIFWTDAKKLNNESKKIFHQHKIKIKDYRSAFLHDGGMEKKQLINFLQLADQTNRIFYVLASDILRLYLLLKTYPVRQPNAIVCYIDCNDIYLNRIPNPNAFKSLKSLAFHFVYFRPSNHKIFAQLIHDNAAAQLLLTNDVIAVRASKKNRPLFSKIFAMYFHNLQQIKLTINEMMDALTWTQQVMRYLDDDLVTVMIFTTTHVVNVLYTYQEKIYLLDFSEDKLASEELENIQDVEDYIDFERDYSKGFTCLQRDPISEAQAFITPKKEQCREFWYQLFLQRQELLHSLFPRSIAD